MIQRMMIKCANVIPQQWKRMLSGTYQQNSQAGRVIHTFLNTLPINRFPVLPCDGVLHPYQMKIDWKRHRSFIYGTWEPDIVQFIVQHVKKDMVAIDVGSHIGFYTLLLAKLVGAQGIVLAFEPLPQNFKILEENIRLNHLDYVQPFNKAVAERLRTVELHLDERAPLPGQSTLISGQYTGGQTIAVEAVTLDDYVSELERPVNFLKIDVEGAEDLVLQGAMQTLEQYHPTMMIELHAFRGHTQTNAVISMLESLNYQIHWIDDMSITAHILATYKK